MMFGSAHNAAAPGGDKLPEPPYGTNSTFPMFLRS